MALDLFIILFMCFHLFFVPKVPQDIWPLRTIIMGIKRVYFPLCCEESHLGLWRINCRTRLVTLFFDHSTSSASFHKIPNHPWWCSRACNWLYQHPPCIMTLALVSLSYLTDLIPTNLSICGGVLLVNFIIKIALKWNYLYKL